MKEGRSEKRRSEGGRGVEKKSDRKGKEMGGEGRERQKGGEERGGKRKRAGA